MNADLWKRLALDAAGRARESHRQYLDAVAELVRAVERCERAREFADADVADLQELAAVSAREYTALVGKSGPERTA